MREQRRQLSTSLLLFCPTGNAGLRVHFPAPFERSEDRGEIEEAEQEEVEGRGQEDDRLAEGPAEQAGLSVEVQIGRKLREIGDKFQQDHVELVSLTPLQQMDLPKDKKRDFLKTLQSP